MAFRLCLALGYPHPDVLLANITAKQWGDWKAFYALDPWGDWRMDRRFALIGSMLAARKGKKVEMDDLMLFDPEAEKRRDSRKKAQVGQLRSWFEGMASRGGKPGRK